MATAQVSPPRLPQLWALLAVLLAACGEDNPDGSAALQITLENPPNKFIACGAEVPLTTRARTESGEPVGGLAVRFTVEGGGGQVSAPSAVTDADGVATVTWTLGSQGNVVNLVSVAATDPSSGADSTFITQSVTTRTRIAFASRLEDNLDIYVIDPDGGNRVRLTTDPADDYDPAWSPNGARIAFTSERDDDSEVYAMSASGEDQTNLTQTPGLDYGPKWSHDGRKIAFTRSSAFLDSDVYVMDTTGANQLNLTEDEDENGSDPSWSPDDTRLSFTRVNEVWVMGADGSQPTQLSFHLSPSVRQCCSAWSPDGSVVGYLWAFTVSLRIDANTPDGMHQTTIVGEQDGISGFAWSPEGDRIAYTGGAVRVVTVADSQVVPVADISSTEVAWSPDGGSIAFIGRPSAGGGVHVVHADGTGLLSLASDPETSGVTWSGCVP